MSSDPHTRASSTKRAQLVLVFQCDRPLRKPMRVSLDGATMVTVGRGGNREIVPNGSRIHLSLDDGMISSEHARLVFAGGTWVLEDRDSKHGTFVNGKHEGRFILRDGVLVDLGRCLLLYRDGDEDASTEGDLPALRDRREDLGMLIAAIVRQHAARADAFMFTIEAARALFLYDWPDDMHELEQSLKSAIALAEDATVDVAQLPAKITG